MSTHPKWLSWSIAGMLTVGAISLAGVASQSVLDLRAPLAGSLPDQVDGLVGKDAELSELERSVAGVTDYLMRVYERPAGNTDGVPWTSLYVGYYSSQGRGQTIHSPKNCMPGAGWEALESSPVLVPVAGGSVEVNRYRLVNDGQQVLVLYWYQGRGRVVASEYRAKWELLRDAALHRRSDEALVRIVVPVVGTEDQALEFALALASRIVPTLTTVLPAA